MTYNPNEPRIPAGSANGGEWTSSQLNAFEAAARKGAGLNPKMKTINSFKEILEAAQGETLYVRWSRGPVLDKKQGNSFDQVSKTYHTGLSAQNLRTDSPQLMARMIPEYRFVRRQDEKRYPWIFSGTRIGTDSDGAPLIDANSIVPVGKISEDLLDKMIRFSDAANAREQKYLNNAWKPEHHEKNAKIQKEFDDAWDALK